MFVLTVVSTKQCSKVLVPRTFFVKPEEPVISTDQLLWTTSLFKDCVKADKANYLWLFSIVFFSMFTWRFIISLIIHNNLIIAFINWVQFEAQLVKDKCLYTECIMISTISQYYQCASLARDRYDVIACWNSIFLFRREIFEH